MDPGSTLSQSVLENCLDQIYLSNVLMFTNLFGDIEYVYLHSHIPKDNFITPFLQLIKALDVARKGLPKMTGMGALEP